VVLAKMNISAKNKNFFFSLKTIIIVFVTSAIFVLDRVSKDFIIKEQLNKKSIFINEYLNFDLVWNTGIGFGLFSQNANIYYHLISLLIFSVILFLIYLIVKAEFVEKILFSLILGGALGNLYDRIIYFAVPDFIDLHVNNFHWFTFNIADIFITLGIILSITKELTFNKK
jgi:signal peptidase II